MKSPKLQPKTFIGSKQAALKFALNLGAALKTKDAGDALGACDTALKFLGSFKKELTAPLKWDVDMKKKTKW